MEEIDSYSTTIRVISTVLVVLSSGGNLLAVYLLMSTPRNERSTFVLLLKIFCGSMAIGCLTGWLTLDTLVSFLFILLATVGQLIHGS